MAIVKLSNCGHDENGKYAGGKAGDQTGTEYQIMNWYDRPWLCVLRFEDKKIAAMIADMAKKAAENDLIGYDQGTNGNYNDRYTFWQQLKASGYDPAKIKVACESDCSASTAAIVKGAGYRLKNSKLQNVSIYLTTYNMRAALQTAGAKLLLDKKYLTSGDYIMAGDILLNDNHHVAIAITSGDKAGASSDSKGYLSKGDTGADVKTMQEMLIKAGYSCGSYGADGDFGSGTDAALRKFQKENGLTIDGKYGEKSKEKLAALYGKKINTGKKDLTTVAQEVLAGKWGNDPDRSKKLKTAGYDPTEVQAKVNELYKASKNTKSVDEIAQEILAGKWGNNPDRSKKLKAAGYDPAVIQKRVNELSK